MDKYIINGGKKLYGKIQLQSAKNTVLPLLAAAVVLPHVRPAVSLRSRN